MCCVDIINISGQFHLFMNVTQLLFQESLKRSTADLHPETAAGVEAATEAGVTADADPGNHQRNWGAPPAVRGLSS